MRQHRQDARGVGWWYITMKKTLHVNHGRVNESSGLSHTRGRKHLPHGEWSVALSTSLFRGFFFVLSWFLQSFIMLCFCSHMLVECRYQKNSLSSMVFLCAAFCNSFDLEKSAPRKGAAPLKTGGSFSPAGSSTPRSVSLTQNSFTSLLPWRNVDFGFSFSQNAGWNMSTWVIKGLFHTEFLHTMSQCEFERWWAWENFGRSIFWINSIKTNGISNKRVHQTQRLRCSLSSMCKSERIAGSQRLQYRCFIVFILSYSECVCILSYHWICMVCLVIYTIKSIYHILCLCRSIIGIVICARHHFGYDIGFESWASNALKHVLNFTNTAICSQLVNMNKPYREEIYHHRNSSNHITLTITLTLSMSSAVRCGSVFYKAK